MSRQRMALWKFGGARETRFPGVVGRYIWPYSLPRVKELRRVKSTFSRMPQDGSAPQRREMRHGEVDERLKSHAWKACLG
jgi:hypothetical protein